MQHRVAWSHFGGTWGLPGGARHEGESAIRGAVREAQEEAGVPDGAVRPRAMSVLDLKIWSYATVIADVVTPFEPVISDPESVALEWVPIADVDTRELHPGLAEAWPRLREWLDVRPAVVVDSANVVGAVPDGWWKDRAGATNRLRDQLTRWHESGVEATVLGVGLDRWFPEVSLVVEGDARSVEESENVGEVRLVRAPGAGDDAIVSETERRISEGNAVTAVTSDKELRTRLEAVGARVEPAGWLRAQLD